MIRQLIFLAALSFPLFAFAQRKVEAEKVHATQMLTIGKNATRHDFTAATDTITVASTHAEIPTARSVWELLDSIAAGTQTIDTFSIVSNTLRLSLENDGQPFKSVDLSPYLDDTDTDDQVVDTFAIMSNTLRLSLQDDGQPFKSVDLSPYLDDTDTDDQVVDTFAIMSNTLRLSLQDDGQPFKSVDLSPYLDDTDTDDQVVDTFAIVSNILRLSLQDDGQPFKSVDLSPYLDDTDTDDQTLTIDSTLLSGLERFRIDIADGNSIYFDIPRPTLDTFSLSGTTLSASVSNDGLPAKTVSFSGWDNDASNDLTTSTTFSGDVGGAYNSLAIGAGKVISSHIRDTTIVTQDIKDGAVTPAKMAGFTANSIITATSGGVPTSSGNFTFETNTIRLNTTSGNDTLLNFLRSGTSPFSIYQFTDPYNGSTVAYRVGGLNGRRIFLEGYGIYMEAPFYQEEAAGIGFTGSTGDMRLHPNGDYYTATLTGDNQTTNRNLHWYFTSGGSSTGKGNPVVFQQIFSNNDTLCNSFELLARNTAVGGITHPDSTLLRVGNWDRGTALNILQNRNIGFKTRTPAYSLDINATDGIRLPRGTTAQRPSSTPEGVLRYNSDSTALEFATGSVWIKVAGGGGVADHGALTGLGDDDHTQYALLAGRSGGQSLTGGTASGNNLILNSTSHATKGAVLIGADGSKSVLANSIYYRGDITPTTLGSNTDDWAPSGLDTCSTIRITASSAVELTGITGGADGRILYLHNVGEHTVTLKDNTTSSSANRFEFDADITLGPGQGAILRYDGTNSKWRCAGSSTWARYAVTYTYTTPQTNTAVAVPTGAKVVDIFCLAGGGGGGSGRRGAAGTIRSGGGGGAAGSVSFNSFTVVDLGSPTTLYVNCGAGGNGGIAITTNDTNGANGVAGTNSDVRTSTSAADIFIKAQGGDYGNAGNTAAATGGTNSTSASMFVGGGGASSSATGGTGTSSSANAFVSGGAAGGGITAGDSHSSGGGGGASCMQLYSAVTSGSSGGGNGNTATLVSSRLYGQGGSGGGGNNAGTGGTGGNGIRGGGGGGGGASVNGSNSGAGGNGGDGLVRLIFYF